MDWIRKTIPGFWKDGFLLFVLVFSVIGLLPSQELLPIDPPPGMEIEGTIAEEEGETFFLQLEAALVEMRSRGALSALSRK